VAPRPDAARTEEDDVIDDQPRRGAPGDAARDDPWAVASAADPVSAGFAAEVDLASIEVDLLLDLARDVARGAGELVHAGRRSGTAVASTKTSSVDVVTALDTESERFIRQAIAAARPQDGVLGEEYGHVVGSSGLTWVVDPIDGTVNFLYGIPAYAVSIAVVTGDPYDSGARTLLAACVQAPAQGRSYWASRGKGAWRSDEYGTARLRVGDPVPLAQALVGTGFGYRPERRTRQGKVLATLIPQVRDVRRAGAASLDLCAVAAGELDGYYERGLKPWDLAAGELVVREAGGVVTGLRGRSPGEHLTLAGTDGFVAALTPLLEALGADADEE
jgi:myo-inositol-1(or 4)-monophosphatase